MLSHALRRQSTINPYLAIVLTFLTTELKHRPTFDALECSVPWGELTAFFARTARKIMISQGLMKRRTGAWVG